MIRKAPPPAGFFMRDVRQMLFAGGFLRIWRKGRQRSLCGCFAVVRSACAKDSLRLGWRDDIFHTVVIPLSYRTITLGRKYTARDMRIPQLETERLLFRHPRRSDLPLYTRYCLSERSKYVGGPFNEVQAFEKLASMIGHWELRGFGRFVFLERETERPLGHLGALQLGSSEPPEITWTLWNEVDEGKGFATEAGVAFKSYAMRELGLYNLIAHIDCDNSASRRLAERLGGELDAEATPPSWLPNSVLFRFRLMA